MRYCCDRCHKVGEFKEGEEVKCLLGCVASPMFPLSNSLPQKTDKEPEDASGNETKPIKDR